MSLQISIPDSALHALRLPEAQTEKAILQELAIALYQQDFFPFGKARELAQLDKYAFGQLLGQRSIDRHYTSEELQDDLSYAGYE